MKTLVFRILPKQDLRQEINSHCRSANVKSGCIISAVGCVSTAVVRIADGKTMQTKQADMEIVSLTGTITSDGDHLHILCIDNDHQPFGGHLKEGTLVNTTCEVVIADFSDEWTLHRSFDMQTGYDELTVSQIIGSTE
ncbi:MAG: PPC domain-containing DNA-binding protein [Erysipelotrichaceae bacterium]